MIDTHSLLSDILICTPAEQSVMLNQNNILTTSSPFPCLELPVSFQYSTKSYSFISSPILTADTMRWSISIHKLVMVTSYFISVSQVIAFCPNIVATGKDPTSTRLGVASSRLKRVSNISNWAQSNGIK